MIAVDPGKNGGFAFWIWREEEPYMKTEAFPMPETDEAIFNLLDLCRAGRGEATYLEDLVKYTGRNIPSSAMSVYARNFGFIKGVLTALHFNVILVPPKKWQKALGLGSAKGLSRTEWKNKLKEKAKELFPSIDVTLKTCDALLILEAARKGTLD